MCPVFVPIEIKILSSPDVVLHLNEESGSSYVFFNFICIVHVQKKHEELRLKYKKMYWLMGRRSTLSIHDKLMLFEQILTPVWIYGIQLWGDARNRATLTSFDNFKTRYLGTPLMHLGISETPTSIGTFKGRWLRMKLESLLRNM